MAKTFKIATSSKVGDFFMIGDKNKVSEDFFWQVLTDKIKKLTEDQPEKFDETLSKAKAHLISQVSNLTIEDTWFEIKGKDKK